MHSASAWRSERPEEQVGHDDSTVSQRRRDCAQLLLGNAEGTPGFERGWKLFFLAFSFTSFEFDVILFVLVTLFEFLVLRLELFVALF
jgi:hypothetical protein